MDLKVINGAIKIVPESDEEAAKILEAAGQMDENHMKYSIRYEVAEPYSSLEIMTISIGKITPGNK